MGGGGDDRITIRGDYGYAYGDEGADVLDIVGFGASAYGGDGDDSIDVRASGGVEVRVLIEVQGYLSKPN